METIYDWLLHNTGNAGNYYTILNTQRDASDGFDVMARSSDFKIINLLIQHTQPAGPPADQHANKSYVFRDEQQVIDFLTDGKTPEAQPDGSAKDIRVSVTEPEGEAGEVTFPPAQS